MKYFQPLAVAAFAGLAAAKPVTFTGNSLAVRYNGVAEAVAVPADKREPIPQAKGKGKATGKGQGKGKRNGKGKKRESELADYIENIIEREAIAEPLDLADVDSVVVARTPDAEADPELFERQTKGKGSGKGQGKGNGNGKGKGQGKGQGNGKAKKGKRRQEVGY